MSGRAKVPFNSDAPAEDYFALYNQGAEVWNSWAVHALDALGRNSVTVSPLTEDGRAGLADKLRLSNLPDPLSISFSGLEIDQRINLKGYIIPNLSCIGTKFKKAFSLSGARYVGSIDLNGATFMDRADFTRIQFFDSGNFFNVTFEKKVDFSNSTFHQLADFTKLRVAKFADFIGVQFNAELLFLNASIPYPYFERSIFRGKADFSNSVFSRVRFTRCEFLSDVKFDAVGFGKLADYRSVNFKSFVSFLDARMGRSSLFNNAVFGDVTEFIGCRFPEAPQFHGATLHQGTTFMRCHFNITDTLRHVTPKEMWERRRQAWRTLKFAMNKIHAHEEELLFFSLELQARSYLEPIRTRIAIWLYGFLSGFGQSIVRPLIGLAISFLLFAAVYAAQATEKVCFSPPFKCFVQWDIVDDVIAYSTIGALPFLNQTRIGEKLADHIFGKDINSFIYVISTMQSLFSLLFIFLIGLGLRNLFRLKSS